MSKRKKLNATFIFTGMGAVADTIIKDMFLFRPGDKIEVENPEPWVGAVYLVRADRHKSPRRIQ